MAEMWDIAQYVEEHPDDHEQRWRLAKKMYMAGEYRIGLEHLLVLRNEWADKINVVRYLSATYYRLGRYEEAAAELERAVAAWPDEIGIYEQYVRALEVLGRYEDALKAWERIKELDPAHALYDRAVKRLNGRLQRDTPRVSQKPFFTSDPGLNYSAAGANETPAPGKGGHSCPSCGANNAGEFERCWQCHTPLGAAAPPPAPPAPDQTPQVASRLNAKAWAFRGLVLCAIAALIGCAVLLAKLNLSAASLEKSGQTVSVTVHDFLSNRFALSHTVCGVVLVVAWPAALWLSLALARAAKGRVLAALGSGLLLAGLVWTVSYAPWGVAIGAVLGAIGSLALLVVVFRLPWGKALAVWLGQLCLAGVACFGGFVAVAGLGPLPQLGAITAYAISHDSRDEPGQYLIPVGRAPATCQVVWQPTGSSLLDANANMVEFRITTEPLESPLLAILRLDGAAVAQHTFSGPYAFRTRVLAGRTYALDVAWRDPMPMRESVPITIRVCGVLAPEFTR